MQPTTPPRLARLYRPVSAVSSCLLAMLLLAMAAASAPAASDRHAGMRLLEAQLPPGSSVARADCESMVRAVRRATLAHHRQVGAILTAALLEVPARPDDRSRVRWSCACVRRILVTAVRAAPDHTSELLETAVSLAPECADELSKALDGLDGKNVVEDPKDRGGSGNDPDGRRNGRDSSTADNGDPNAPPSGLSDRDYRGLDMAGNRSEAGFGGSNVPGSASSTDGGSGFGSGFVGGFGSGLGPGFPGSPGFAGSSPGGGFALPVPVAVPVTAVTNN